MHAKMSSIVGTRSHLKGFELLNWTLDVASKVVVWHRTVGQQNLRASGEM
jgi:hypothetical protein